MDQPKMVKCQFCQRMIPAGLQFCPYCGARQEVSQTTQSQPPITNPQSSIDASKPVTGKPEIRLPDLKATTANFGYSTAHHEASLSDNDIHTKSSASEVKQSDSDIDWQNFKEKVKRRTETGKRVRSAEINSTSKARISNPNLGENAAEKAAQYVSTYGRNASAKAPRKNSTAVKATAPTNSQSEEDDIRAYQRSGGSTWSQANHNFFFYMFSGSGRTSMADFWWAQLTQWLLIAAICLIAIILFSMINPAAGQSAIFIHLWGEKISLSRFLEIRHLLFFMIVGLIYFSINIGLMMRRLHDLGKSAWYLFLNFIPVIGQVSLLILAAITGSTRRNAYGMPTKSTNIAEDNS